jgi:hypothetical protein
LVPCATSDAPAFIELEDNAPYATPNDIVLPLNVPGVTVSELEATLELVPVVTEDVVNVLTSFIEMSPIAGFAGAT